MPHARGIVQAVGALEEAGGGHGRLKGEYEDNQISAVEAMPG